MAIPSHSKDYLSFLLRLTLLIQVTTGEKTTPNQISPIRADGVQLHHSNCGHELNLNDRMSEIEAKSLHQESEISLLKKLRVEDNQVIKQLKDRVEQLEASSVAKNAEKNLARKKRPFRLTPIKFRS